MPDPAMSAEARGLLAIALVLLLPIYFSIRSPMTRVVRSRGRRSHTGGLVMLCWQLLCAGALWLTFQEGLWTADSVGLSRQLPWLLSAMIGLVVFVLFRALVKLPLDLLQRTDEDLDFKLTRAHWPSRPFQKKLAFLALLVNPFTYELSFRGVLVHQLDRVSGSPAFAVALGLLLCLSKNAYQGWSAMPSYALFYAAVVCILYSPLGLVGTIGFHAAADLWWLIRLRKAGLRWRDRRRGRLEATRARAA